MTQKNARVALVPGGRGVTGDSRLLAVPLAAARPDQRACVRPACKVTSPGPAREAANSGIDHGLGEGPLCTSASAFRLVAGGRAPAQPSCLRAAIRFHFVAVARSPSTRCTRVSPKPTDASALRDASSWPAVWGCPSTLQQTVTSSRGNGRRFLALLKPLGKGRQAFRDAGAACRHCGTRPCFRQNAPDRDDFLMRKTFAEHDRLRRPSIWQHVYGSRTAFDHVYPKLTATDAVPILSLKEPGLCAAPYVTVRLSFCLAAIKWA